MAGKFAALTVNAIIFPRPWRNRAISHASCFCVSPRDRPFRCQDEIPKPRFALTGSINFPQSCAVLGLVDETGCTKFDSLAKSRKNLLQTNNLTKTLVWLKTVSDCYVEKHISPWTKAFGKSLCIYLANEFVLVALIWTPNQSRLIDTCNSSTQNVSFENHCANGFAECLRSINEQ